MNLHQREGKNKENKDLFVINLFRKPATGLDLEFF